MVKNTSGAPPGQGALAAITGAFTAAEQQLTQEAQTIGIWLYVLIIVVLVVAAIIGIVYLRMSV